jgi:integrase
MGQIRKRGAVYWIRYYRNGKRYEESTKSTKKQKAIDLLKIREGDIAKGVPVTPAHGRVTFDEARADLEREYEQNGRKSLGALTRRLDKHLTPYFGGRRLAQIGTAEIRAYVASRLAETTVTHRAYTRRRKDGTTYTIPARERAGSQGTAAATINRELAALKRLFTLARRARRILADSVPHIPMLAEDNVRTGFFERETFEAVRAALPADLRPVVTFAYLTGWRKAEILGLDWRQIDFAAQTVTLDPGTTKNREGRVFPFGALPELRDLLVRQRADTDALERQSKRIIPAVFHRQGARIRSIDGAWRAACTAAGVPGRLLHDCRRTAVRNLVRAGVPERVAMMLTGHKTRSVFERYNIVSEADLTAAVAKLAMGTVQGQSTPGATVHPIAASR